MHPYFYCLSILLLVLLNSCQSPNPTSSQPSSPHPYLAIKGETMGTYYAIQYSDAKRQNYQSAIDSLLAAFNQSLSTYISNSIISQVNQAQAQQEVTVDDFFTLVFQYAQHINQETNGAFDPTVMPLVNAWGFGFQKRDNPPDTSTIDSLKNMIGLNHFFLEEKENGKTVITKDVKGSALDFSAIAKGYAVDLVARLLKDKGSQHFMVDIGGEVKTFGRNSKGQVWTIGIDQPLDSIKERRLEHAVYVDHQAVASSGNYRNFYIKDGIKYAHTINPQTGYPELSRLLGVSIFAPTCLEADAYATACMVMGLEKAKQFVKNKAGVEAILIYANEQNELESVVTSGVKLKE